MTSPDNAPTRHVSGDLNQDGKLDKEDLQLLRTLLQELPPGAFQGLSPEEQAILDVNHDGQVDQRDIIALCEKLAGNADGAAALQEKLAALRSRLK